MGDSIRNECSCTSKSAQLPTLSTIDKDMCWEQIMVYPWLDFWKVWVFAGLLTYGKQYKENICVYRLLSQVDLAVVLAGQQTILSQSGFL